MLATLTTEDMIQSSLDYEEDTLTLTIIHDFNECTHIKNIKDKYDITNIEFLSKLASKICEDIISFLKEMNIYKRAHISFF